MLVKDIMSCPVITVTEKDTVGKAMEIMKNSNIRHLPVVDVQGDLVGVIAERDVLKVFPRKKNFDKYEFNLLSRTPVSCIMSPNPVIVSSKETIESAAMLMEKRDVGCIPVVDEDKLIGLVSEADIFNTFASAMGMEKAGLRLTIKLERKRGYLAKLVEILDANNAIIDNFVTFPEEIVIKVKNSDDKKLLKELAQEGFEVTHFAKNAGVNLIKEESDEIKIG